MYAIIHIIKLLLFWIIVNWINFSLSINFFSNFH